MECIINKILNKEKWELQTIDIFQELHGDVHLHSKTTGVNLTSSCFFLTGKNRPLSKNIRLPTFYTSLKPQADFCIMFKTLHYLLFLIFCECSIISN